MIHKIPKMYRTKLGALSEHHLIFHSRGAERKMNEAIMHSHRSKRRMLGY